jgi:hypothetical protein
MGYSIKSQNSAPLRLAVATQAISVIKLQTYFNNKKKSGIQNLRCRIKNIALIRIIVPK